MIGPRRVRVYGWVGGDAPHDVAAAVRRQLDTGLTAVKMNACGQIGPLGTAADTACATVRASIAPEVLGPDRDFALDFYGRVSAPMARRLIERWEPLHPPLIEEPVPLGGWCRTAG